MDGEQERGATTIDWRLVVTSIGVFWALAVGVGGLFRSHLLAAVDERINTHSENAAAKRVEFFRHVESEASGAVGRITTLEQHCATVRDWRLGVDAELSALRETVHSNSQKIERVLTWMEAEAERLRELLKELERVQEKLEHVNGKR